MADYSISRRQRIRKRRERMIVVGVLATVAVLLVAVTVVIAVLVFLPPGTLRGVPSLSREPTPEQLLDEAELTDDASSIYELFKSNTLAADQKYNGRRMIVIGRVALVDRDRFGTSTVYVGLFRPSCVVLRYGAGQEDKLRDLRAGGWLATFGTCDGLGSDGTAAIFSDCRFVAWSSSGGPDPIFTAEHFQAVYTRDIRGRQKDPNRR